MSGVGEEDIFGTDGGGEPATPGTYGLAPEGFRLPAGTRLGPVRLQVADLDRSLDWYGEVLGMAVLERGASEAVLGTRESDGAAATPLVELVERPGARPSRRHGRTGLFHFALLVPDRAALGRFVVHLGRLGRPAGAGDHLVSESLYLHDPDDLGIEVYADQLRERWRRRGRELMMATDPLDLDDLVRAAGGAPWAGLPTGTAVGHLHLHVGDLARAAAFYSAALGLDRTVWSYPGALFLAAGGYHHHLGTNVWAGAGATPPAADEAQLLAWTIELPDLAALEATAASLGAAGHPVERRENGAAPAAILTRDPWGTPLRLRLAARSAH
jgi:catechol 2,3-dioxygenase